MSVPGEGVENVSTFSAVGIIPAAAGMVSSGAVVGGGGANSVHMDEHSLAPQDRSENGFELGLGRGVDLLGDVGQHDRVVHQAGIFELLLLFDGVVALLGLGNRQVPWCAAARAAGMRYIDVGEGLRDTSDVAIMRFTT